MGNLLRIESCVIILFLWVLSSVSASVTYDHKSLIINGQRRILFSGAIHYPRSTPDMWPGLIQKAKEGGLDAVETYVFWNGHEPQPGKFYFEDRFDLVKFLKLVHEAGLYAILRIGPFVCAEWNFGGFPVWLKYVRGISFRTDNEPFKAAMQRFTEHIVNIMKAERMFEPLGGPIILAQIENEYGPVEWELGAPGKAYSDWAAKMAVGLKTGVPWVMCKQDDPPDPIINTCNGYYCEGFTPNQKYKPKIWTENWTGWLTEYGAGVPKRPVEDISYAVTRFIENGGSVVNYYMFHGGTNFGRTSGLFVATSYDYDAFVDEFGLLNQPKWGHMKELHGAIKQCESALLSVDPEVTWLGKNLEARVFKTKSSCAAFLGNYDPKTWGKVRFGNAEYDLPPWSVSILPDCKTVAFNTAKVNAPWTEMNFTPVIKWFSWQSYNEIPGSPGAGKTFSKFGLVEQVNTTWDSTDYLWYMTEIDIKSHDLKNGHSAHLTVMSAGHVLHVFVNGQYSGTAYGSLGDNRLTFSQEVELFVGSNKIALLSASVGLPNVGVFHSVHFETWNVGVLGPVTLSGLSEGARDLSKQTWYYQIGLKGEFSAIYTERGSTSVNWVGGSAMANKRPLTWYKTTFDEPAGNDPLALDMLSMGKGQIWINGHSIGRHWPAYIAKGNCVDKCNYAGTYTDTKCRLYCGTPSQRWFHVPRGWLKPTGNLLVVFDEMGGDIGYVALTKETR
ncbi:hypothetical protein QN277_026580 [Acacia crassicarpa]|uniref:Beta-galactosidase n=1 Tax=Acacia crassicarpa TaxID=499986 RepID=A0AAE1JBN1_9FABA|nr:hypothetical protein QN277_026580 [Acacia crassicarpa]